MSPAYLKRVRERGRNAEVIHGKCYDRQPNPVDGGGRRREQKTRSELNESG